MANGWIKVHRGMLEHGIFRDGDLLRLWMYLLLKATYRELDLPVGRQVVHLEPGQLLYGRQAVNQKLDIGEYQLRKMMAQLEQLGSLTIESHSRYSIVTITNWVQYQQEQGKPEFPFDVDFLDEPENEDDEITLEELMELERQMWGEPLMTMKPEHCRGGYQPPATEAFVEGKNRQLESQSASGLEDDLNNNFASKAPTENHKQEEKNNNINKDKNKKRKNIKIKRNITELKQNKRKEEKNKTKENNKKTQNHITTAAGGGVSADQPMPSSTLTAQDLQQLEQLFWQQQAHEIACWTQEPDTVAVCEDGKIAVA